METKPGHAFDTDCLSKSQRIVLGTNWSHFLALSFLFFPLSLSFIIDPTLSLSGNFFTIDQKPVLSHIFYIVIVCILPFCAIAMITYSTYHAFSDKPVKFFHALKSLTVSFFPLVSTAFVAAVFLAVILLTFLLFVGAFVVLGQNLGFVIDYSIRFSWFSVIVGAPLIVMILYLHLNWSLAFVVVVAESKWGFEALIRSSYLLRGMRLTSLSLLQSFVVSMGKMCFYSYNFYVLDMGSSIYALVLLMVGAIIMMWFLLCSTAANTVLYMHCKAFHGALATDIADESAHDKQYKKQPHYFV